MKKILLMILCLLLCLPSASAESFFDNEELQRMENTYTFIGR